MLTFRRLAQSERSLSTPGAVVENVARGNPIVGQSIRQVWDMCTMVMDGIADGWQRANFTVS